MDNATDSPVVSPDTATHDAAALYRNARAWCIAHTAPLRPGDLMREFRIGYSRAATLLEDLERDRVLRRLDGEPGRYTSRVGR